MVSSLIGFWVCVRAFASTAPSALGNALLLLAAVAVVLLVVALWFRALRAAALGTVGGLAVGTAAAVLVAGLVGSG